MAKKVPMIARDSSGVRRVLGEVEISEENITEVDVTTGEPVMVSALPIAFPTRPVSMFDIPAFRSGVENDGVREGTRDE